MMVRLYEVVKKKVMCNKQYQVIQGTVWKSNMVCRKRIYEVQDIGRIIKRQACPTHQSPQVFQGLPRGSCIESIKMNLGTTPGFDLGRSSETLAVTITPGGGTWESTAEGNRQGEWGGTTSSVRERGKSTVQTTSDFFNPFGAALRTRDHLSDILKIRN